MKRKGLFALGMILISLLLTIMFMESASANPKKGKTVISDLKKEPAASPAAIDEDFQIGDPVYTNRDYKWINIPEEFVGMPRVVPPNSWEQDPDIEIKFKIDRDSWIWVLWPHDPDRATKIWLTEDYEEIIDENTMTPMYIFEGDFTSC
jgi:hypothetical protein